MRLSLTAALFRSGTAQTPEEEFSIRTLKRALNRLGYYILPAQTGITADRDEGFRMR